MGRNHVPDHVPEMMKHDFGTSVLITDPKSYQYLKRSQKIDKNQWSESHKKWR